jgi:hypothetical protein
MRSSDLPARTIGVAAGAGYPGSSPRLDSRLFLFTESNPWDRLALGTG